MRGILFGKELFTVLSELISPHLEPWFRKLRKTFGGKVLNPDYRDLGPKRVNPLAKEVWKRAGRSQHLFVVECSSSQLWDSVDSLLAELPWPLQYPKQMGTLNPGVGLIYWQWVIVLVSLHHYGLFFYFLFIWTEGNSLLFKTAHWWS